MPLADVVLIVHALIACFIALGFLLIPLGGWRGWAFVRHRWLRQLHLAGILVVAAEIPLGIACPLTLWENALRGGGSDIDFVARWVRGLLYYDVPLWVFGATYLAGAIVAVGLWFWVPPVRR
jgi:hypothetical protein